MYEYKMKIIDWWDNLSWKEKYGIYKMNKGKLKADIHEILDDESALSCLDEDEWEALLSKIDKVIDECC